MDFRQALPGAPDFGQGALPAGVADEQRRKFQDARDARMAVAPRRLPGERQFGIKARLGRGQGGKGRAAGGMGGKKHPGAFLGAGRELLRRLGQRPGQGGKGRKPRQRRPGLGDHGRADKGGSRPPGMCRAGVGKRPEMAGVRGQGQPGGVGEAGARKLRQAVGVVGKDHDPGRNHVRVVVENEPRAVHEPGGQGQVQVGKERGQTAFAVEAQVVDGEREIRPERGRCRDDGRDRILPARFAASRVHDVTGEAKAL